MPRKLQVVEKKVWFKRPEVFEAALTDVVGQIFLKRKLASAFSQYTLYLDDPEAGRPVVLVAGPSGSGKTFTVELLVKTAGLPFTIASAASLSPPGVKGTTLKEMLAGHWLEHHTDVGVIFLDEIDKQAVPAHIATTEEGQYKRAFQTDLLRLLESESLTFMDDSKDIEALEGLIFETRHILWVMAGAFVGLDTMVRKRLAGTNLPPEELWEHALPQDFVRYGFAEELANRIGTWAWTKPLTAQQMIDALQRQDVPRWVRRFRALDCELDLQLGALGACASYAHESKSGVRGASSLLRRTMDDVFAEAGRNQLHQVTVDAHVVRTGHLAGEEIHRAV